MRDRSAWRWLTLAAVAVLAVLAARAREPTPLFALSCCMVGVLAGRLADGRREHAQELRREVQQLTAALCSERSARQLLQVAQRRLLRQLPEPACLERAISEAVARLANQRSWNELGHTVLSVLGEHGSIQSAVLFAAHSGGGLLDAPVARLGSLTADVRHGLVARAFRSGKLAMPADPTSLSAATADVLAALPLRAEGRVLGVVAVQRLQFEAYEPQHLTELTLLLQPLAAAIARALAADSPPARWGMIA